LLILAVNLFNLLVNFIVGLIVARFLGPESFGRFAVAIGTGGLIQLLFFGWLRLAATRFYSADVREERPDLRASLDRALWGLGGILIAAGAGIALWGGPVGISAELVFWALAFAAANGAFEYQLALLRARFHDRGYAVLTIMKNVLTIALTAGFAYATGSAALTLAGTTASVAISALVMRVALPDPAARHARTSGAILKESLAYGAPLSASLLFFALIPLANRAFAGQVFGFAEAGQLALAQDVGLRLVLAIGTAMDVLLFQIAVRADEHHGIARGRAQVAQNMAIMAAILLPALAGVWLVLPSFQALIVPPEFQGAFARALTLLLPGLACYGLMTFAIAPAFQIVRRTWPVIACAAVACAADAAFLVLLPKTWGADGLAIAQTGAFAAGLVALIALTPMAKPEWPRGRDLVAIPAATLVMLAAGAQLRHMEPGVTAMALQAATGAAIYAALVMAFDIAGLRTVIMSALARR
jgi:O-antigen/teichoic acid export membrane protein